eukprot:gb/GECG01004896.1/.p1 GENE.gb/GECG01004896.1/~~gb/GECG01004896.1/.p1  ORF type:complete len:664 (+),score=109.34 gb/GECG01004896.1/:1-1992(+)
MPISCPYTWQETPQEVELVLTLRGVSPTNVDIFSTDYFVRINAPPTYLTTIDFKFEVDESHSTARFDGHTLRMVFPKKDPHAGPDGDGLWKELLFQGTAQERDERRKKATEEKQEREAEERKRRKEAKHDYDRDVLRKQMSVEQSQRKHLEELKEQEKKAAEKDMYETFATLQKGNRKEKSSDIWTEQDTDNAAPASHSGSAPTTDDSLQYTKTHDDDEGTEEEYIPPPRSLRQGGKAKVTVKFSERPFPTPLRDSRKAEEQDWLKQNQHRIDAKKRRDREKQGQGLNHLEQRTIDERNPEWLKSKGDEFYSQGDHLGAINAYSATLERDPVFISAMMNRAACHLHRGSLHHCIFDCSNALKQLPPSPLNPQYDVSDIEEMVLSESSKSDLSRVGLMTDTYQRYSPSKRHLEGNPEQNASEKEKTMIMRAHIRRGRALCELGDYERAAEDFLAASCVRALIIGYDTEKAVDLSKSAEVHPESSLAVDRLFMGIRADIRAANRMVECSRIKKEADSLFKRGQHKKAADLYSKCLDMEQNFAGALANRAACYWKIRNLGACVKDCTRILEILTSVAKFQQQEQEIPSEYFPVPREGSEIHKRLKVSSLIKRANAYYTMGLTQDAFQDLKGATSLDPAIPEVQNDSRKLATKLAVRETTTDEPPQS